MCLRAGLFAACVLLTSSVDAHTGHLDAKLPGIEVLAMLIVALMFTALLRPGWLLYGITGSCLLFGAWNKQALYISFTPLSSPIDWCEDNYATTPLVAEFWNTISSLSFVVAGCAVPFFFTNEGMSLRDAKGKMVQYEPNFIIIWLFIIMVGVGSTLFHATLSVAGQVLDELPICLLVGTATLMATPRHQWTPRHREQFFSRKFFLCMTPSLTVMCVLYPMLSHVVCLLAVPMTVVGFLRLYFQMPPAVRPTKTIQVTLALLLTAISCWVADRVYCSELQTLLGFNPQLHGWWHVLMSGVVWTVTMVGLQTRAHGDKIPYQMCTGGPGHLVPYFQLQRVV
jgi:alkaline ceramidase